MTPAIRQAVKTCFEGRSEWPLLLQGGVGAGKSWAGILAVRAAGAGIYITTPDLCRDVIDAQQGRLVRTWTAGGRVLHERDLWDEWEKANLRCLDEIGAREKVSDHHYEVVKRAIDLCVEWNRPLIACTNLDNEQLARVYDDRIVSRLTCGTVVRVSGDRRMA